MLVERREDEKVLFSKRLEGSRQVTMMVEKQRGQRNRVVGRV